MTQPPNHITAALTQAREAHARRDASVNAYRSAIAHATSCGCTYTELAAALGITRQAVRQLRITNH